MKRFLALITALSLSVSLAACSGADPDNNPADKVDSASYKVGIGSYTDTSSSSSSVSGDNGKSVVSTTYATVVFDENNVIKKVYIDEVESKTYFDGNGKLDYGKNETEIKSKRELGDAYNMKPASGIGKEWYEQINSLEDYLVGKNIDDIANYVNSMGAYGTNDDYANSLGNDTDSVMDGAKNAADGVMEGARNAIDGIMDGARNIGGDITRGTESAIDGNDNGDVYDDSTAGGMTGNINEPSGSNSVNNTNSGSTSSGSMTDSNSGDMTSSGNVSSGTLNWEEDLKASVTIDLTNIQRALQKAYANAR